MSRRRAATGAAVALAGTAFLALLYLTSESAAIGGDYYDSPFFWWGWVILPAMAAAAAAIAPEGALMWGGLIVLPQAVATVVGGAYLHDPGEGASFWPIGLMFVGYLGLLATAAAWIVRAWRRRRLSQGPGGPPPWVPPRGRRGSGGVGRGNLPAGEQGAVPGERVAGDGATQG